jgi:hypothetical protein
VKPTDYSVARTTWCNQLSEMDSLRPGSAQFYSQPSGQCHGVNKLTPEVAAAYDAPYPFMIHNLGTGSSQV